MERGMQCPPPMLKLSSVRAARPHPPIMGRRESQVPSEKESNPRTLWTSTLKAGSELLMICVKETATFDMLTVAATCPIVWARATYSRDEYE